jgi:hypothetical protein
VSAYKQFSEHTRQRIVLYDGVMVVKEAIVQFSILQIC